MKPLILTITALLMLSAQSVSANWLLDPSVFEPTYYADHNKDVYEADAYDTAKLINHWLKNGIHEGRISSPVFNVRYYLEKNPDLAKTFGKDNFQKAAEHWFTTGRKEGRASHPQFHVKAYLSKNPEIGRRIGEHNYLGAIDHYLQVGYEKGLKAN